MGLGEKKGVGKCLRIASVVFGLVVPALKSSLLERIPAQAPFTLAFEDLLMNVFEVPSGISFLDEGEEDVLYSWDSARCQVPQLLWIISEIEELRWIGGTGDKFPRASANHHDGGDGAFSRVLAIHTVTALVTEEVWNERIAVHGKTGVKGGSNELDQSRKNIKRRYISSDGSGCEAFRIRDEEGYPGGSFKPRHLVPAQVSSVVPRDLGE